MNIRETRGDLFAAPDDFYLAHCISADYVLGAGIAKKFDEFYWMKSRLKEKYTVPYGSTKYIGKALLIDDAFNLVTKRFCYQKPTFESLKTALIDMKRQCDELGIKRVAMPRITSELDKLPWDGCEECVSNTINGVFGDSNIEILIYTL